MKTILVDDEPIALEVLEHMLEAYEDIDIIGSYTRPIDALNSIEKLVPDIIFLDIEMGEINGLELAEIFLEKLDKVEIVFVTAYSQYAVDAFEINAIDYLLKPIQENRLLKAIERLKERVKENHKKNDKTNMNKLKVCSFGGFQVIDHMGNPLNWRTQKSKELFAYLWKGKERPVPKEIILEAIFPDRGLDKANTILHTTIYQLRKNLKALGYGNGINYLNESYQLDIPITSDREELHRIITLEKHNDEDIIEILKIYRGDFLEEGYPWAMELQQRYRELVLKILEKFAKNQIKNKSFTSILKISLDKAYEIDPLNETIAEMMIHYYGKQKKKSSLEIFFTDYVEKLLEEISLDPREDIRRIYKEYMNPL